jgi:hypothetical protein
VVDDRNKIARAPCDASHLSARDGVRRTAALERPEPEPVVGAVRALSEREERTAAGAGVGAGAAVLELAHGSRYRPASEIKVGPPIGVDHSIVVHPEHLEKQQEEQQKVW